MVKPKHSLETRLVVVNHYFCGIGGVKRWSKTYSRFFGIRSTSVRLRVRAWQLHGIHGITWKNDSHSPEFRETVVRATLCEELTIREVVARFNISNESVVRHWVDVYKASGLLSIKRGRSKVMSKPPKHPHLPMRRWKSYRLKKYGQNSVTASSGNVPRTVVSQYACTEAGGQPC